MRPGDDDWDNDDDDDDADGEEDDVKMVLKTLTRPGGVRF